MQNWWMTDLIVEAQFVTATLEELGRRVMEAADRARERREWKLQVIPGDVPSGE